MVNDPFVTERTNGDYTVLFSDVEIICGCEIMRNLIKAV